MQDSVQWLQDEGGDGQVADLLGLKVPVDLREFGVGLQRVLQSLQDPGVSLQVLDVVVHEVDVERPKHHVPDLLAFLVAAAAADAAAVQAGATLPENEANQITVKLL